jgi:hypothetical protein
MKPVVPLGAALAVSAIALALSSAAAAPAPRGKGGLCALIKNGYAKGRCLSWNIPHCKVRDRQHKARCRSAPGRR